MIIPSRGRENQPVVDEDDADKVDKTEVEVGKVDTTADADLSDEGEESVYEEEDEYVTPIPASASQIPTAYVSSTTGLDQYAYARHLLFPPSVNASGITAMRVDAAVRRARLRIEMERAQQSDHMKTVFLSNISHALRTPLNAIIGFSDVLMSTNESDLPCENRQELYGLINTNGQQLLYFINELLQLSNIEGNELKFDRTEIEVGQQIREFRDEYAGRTAEGVEIKVVDPPQKLKALIDTNLMRLVTTHMLANAVRHTHQGSITISYYEIDGGLRIDIKDTGEGLPEALRDNIFGLLTEKNTYVQSEVPGLGLSICKAIVDGCHGKIGHESPAEGGALFWHWVPCKIIIEV